MIQDIAHLGLVDEQEIELDAAALEIAALDHADVDLEDYVDLLQAMTDRLLTRAVTAHSAAAQAAALADVVAGEFRFHGDRDTYDDPANADLISVIDRRKGMPIALSILYVAVGRRIGWTVHALNTPGHVLVAIGEDEPIIIDPFNRGARVEPEQLVALLQAMLGTAPLRDEHVAPMSNRAALLRLLMNQASRAERSNDAERALAIYERIVTIAPAHSQGWWELGRLQIALEQSSAARESLTSLLETTRDPFVRAQANSALDALAT
ncbi:transglutaminase-like domain-containing protein [Sphingomonas sp.]|jgi:regulator of sirC expression with transglutaminase-like and TPR domain|uniref:SirB1 family protein n=1 Tax=Sphingomonas sp. TaxID=28214 RepID=UPI002DE39F1B|nr:transglutaminase-like domain-containing protein [Sphingomonas sp.]